MRTREEIEKELDRLTEKKQFNRRSNRSSTNCPNRTPPRHQRPLIHLTRIVI